MPKGYKLVITEKPSDEMATLTKLLTNPETAGLLKALVNAMGNEESKKIKNVETHMLSKMQRSNDNSYEKCKHSLDSS